MMTEEEIAREIILEKQHDERRKKCPTCGADESKFTTTIIGDGEGWCIECGDCGELIDED